MTTDFFYNILTFESDFETCFKFVNENSNELCEFSLTEYDHILYTAKDNIEKASKLRSRWQVSEDVIPFSPWLWEERQNTVNISVGFTSSEPLTVWIQEMFERYGNISILTLDYYSEEANLSGFFTNKREQSQLDFYKGDYLQNRLLIDEEILDVISYKLFGNQENITVLSWEEKAAKNSSSWTVDIEEIDYILENTFIKALGIDARSIPAGKKIQAKINLPYRNNKYLQVEATSEKIKVTLYKQETLTGEEYKTDIIGSTHPENPLSLKQLTLEDNISILHIFNELKKNSPKANNRDLFEEAYYRYLDEKEND